MTTTATRTSSAPVTVVRDGDMELKVAYSYLATEELELAEAGLQVYREALQKEEEEVEN